MTRVTVTPGDITVIPTDAIITTTGSGLDPEVPWLSGGVNAAIKQVSDRLFHNQATALRPLRDGQIIIVHENGTSHLGNFNSVVYLVDDLKQPLSEVVTKILETVEKAKIKRVSMPTIRIGAVYDSLSTKQERDIKEIVKGIKEFLSQKPEFLEEIVVVVHYNHQLEEALRGAIG